MAKNRPGLPEGFEIDLDTPSQLGDYLDETFSGNVAKVIAAKRATLPPPQAKPVEALTPVAVTAPRTQVVQQMPASVQKTDSVLDLDEARKRNVARGGSSSFKRPERMQFNMRPDTIKMFNEIVEFVQHYSLQNDAKASEIFDAIIGILSDAKKEMAFTDVPRRGKWGTPTARAFPTALGNAFARAIAMRYAKQGTE